jgi:hypothetical protein
MALVRSDARTASQQIQKRTRRRETPKRKRGRPPIYRPEFAKQVTNYCLLGATNEELGRVFGVDERTINRWLVTKPEFCQAAKDGREVADANVANSLYRKALNGDTAAAFIWLKNRRPDLWRDKKEVDSTSKVKIGGRLQYELSPEARQIPDETLAELGQPTAKPTSTTGKGAAATNGATKY